MRNLRKLSINLKSKEEQTKILEELQGLEILNNENISRKETNQNNIKSEIKPQNEQIYDKSCIRQEDLETLSIIYDSIREVHKEVNSDNDTILADQFDEHVRNILFDLKIKLDNQNNSNEVSKAFSLKAKYALYEICFSKFMDFLGGIDHRLASILENLHDSHALIFKEMSSIEKILY